MAEIVSRVLKEIILKYDVTVCQEPKRLKALLNDLAPSYQKERFVLMTALSENIVQELLSIEQDQLYQTKANYLKNHLIKKCGIAKELATWAVDSWAYALGVITSESSKELYQLGEKFYQAGNYKKAVIYFKKAANLGSAKGQKALAHMYQNGWYERLNYKQSRDWYKKAALNWYQQAARQGEVDAQTILGSIYKRGWGVKQDYKKALNWYLKAAKSGHEFAQYNLAYIYQNGLGVAKNKQQAKKWYQRSARQGNDFAQQALKDLTKDNISS